MPEAKRHSACDECRRRKIKCDGKVPCGHCAGENHPCQYSMRLPMGRPRKRQRSDENEIPQTDNRDETTKVSPLESVGGDLNGLEFMQIPGIDEWTLPATNTAAYRDEQAPLNPMEFSSLALPPDNSSPSPTPNSHDYRDATSHGQTPILWDNGAGFSHAGHCTDQANCLHAHSETEHRDLVADAISVGRTFRLQSSKSPGSDGVRCTCLSSMYLAVSQLEETSESGYPVALIPLKAALRAGKAVLLCDLCPRKLSTSRQNVTFLFTLLNAIASGFDALLKDINDETTQARESGQNKVLLSGDSSDTNRHLHTGGPDCPGRIALELEPDEWNAIVSRSVKKYVFKQKNNMLTLESLIEAMEERQRAWHNGLHPSIETDAQQTAAEAAHEKDWTCLSFTRNVRMIMNSFI